MSQIHGYEAYLSIKQAAGEITISTGTVRRLIKRGEIEAYRFGNQIRIVPEKLIFCNSSVCVGDKDTSKDI